MKQLLVFLLLLCSASVSAQDVIVKKDGSTIVCRVVELTDSEITYKKWSDLNGSNYVMNRADASAINYENGKKVNLSEVINLYKPGNQNDGAQQYNDMALLGIDYNVNRKYNRTKNLAWIGGTVLVGAGAIVFLSGGGVSESNIIGAGLAVGGVVWTSSFLLIANKYKANNQSFLSTVPIFQQNFQVSNSSSFYLGADLLRDNTIGQNTLGLGLRYTF
jgi:hypothetical protein